MKMRAVDNRLKSTFDLVKDANSVIGFSTSCQFKLNGMTSPKYCLAVKCSFKMAAFKVAFGASFETNFFGTAGT